jgi:hypothetical protein
MREYMAAQSAMQVHLPQDQRSRITFSMAAVGSNTGIGAGYAYMLDKEKNTAVTLSVGLSGGETAARIGVGFEFGGTSSEVKLAAIEDKRYEQELERRVSELEAMVSKPTVPDDVIRSQDYARQQQQIDFLQEQSQQYRVELSEIEQLKEDAAKLKRQLQEDAARRKQVLDRYNKKGGV